MYNYIKGGDLASTRVAKPEGHAELAIKARKSLIAKPIAGNLISRKAANDSLALVAVAA